MIFSEKGRVNIKEKKRIHEDWRLKDVKTVLGIRLGLFSKDKIFISKGYAQKANLQV